MNTITVPTVGGKHIEAGIHRDVFTGMYYSTLFGGEFSNCHGRGNTPDEALRCLKIRIYQLRNKKL